MKAREKYKHFTAAALTAFHQKSLFIIGQMWEAFMEFDVCLLLPPEKTWRHCTGGEELDGNDASVHKI